MPKLVFMDHYDSFSFNVLDWLHRGGIVPHEIMHVYWDDAAKLNHVVDMGIPVVFSPGPNHPLDVPPSIALAKKLVGRVPILGVCLGHQILGAVAGATIIPAQDPWHGSVQEMRVLKNEAIFAGFPACFKAAVYHSLVIDRATLPETWEVVAENAAGEVMAMVLKAAPASQAPAWSVQFHPESFMSEWGDRLLKNWLQQSH